MHAEGPCFGLDLAANWIEVSCFTVVLSLVGADALSGLAYHFGNDGIFWPLTTGAPRHQYLLQFVLADHFLIESRYVVLWRGSCDARDSTDHSIELCEHQPAAHAAKNVL